MSEIYIIKRDGERTNYIFSRLRAAENQLKRMLKRHVTRVMREMPTTGTKRGKNVEAFKESVEAVVNHPFTIETVQVDDSWS
jgi:hypothetical protein